jgi:hypothetical protein
MNIENISRYIYLGRKDQTWYCDCKNTLLELFGKAELPLVTDLLAATSINSSLQSNITLFRKAYYEIKNDLPAGKYLPNIRTQILQIRTGLGLSGRKITSFAKAMRGDTNAVVVDIWLLRAFQIDKKYMRYSGPHEGTLRAGGPTDKQYTMIEDWIRLEAKYRGFFPAEISSMIWSGIRKEQTGQAETRYCDQLKFQLSNLFQVI